MGSKNRIAKHILPIMIEEANVKGVSTWVEPFVGGGNMIDKIPTTFKRIGYDLNPHTILALTAIRDFVNELPTEVSEEYYKVIKNKNPSTPIESWVRFVCSFGGKLDNGYARNKVGQNYALCGVKNAKKQSPFLQGVELIQGSYENCSHIENAIIYCDPPYEGTTSYKTGSFDHAKFWDWCRTMAKKNMVFVSEYNAPSDFTCVWEGDVKTNFASQRTGATHTATEKLFKCGVSSV